MLDGRGRIISVDDTVYILGEDIENDAGTIIGFWVDNDGQVSVIVELLLPLKAYEGLFISRIVCDRSNIARVV